MNKRTKPSNRDHPAYNSWCIMKQGCTNRKSPHFHSMGERGATFVQRWDKFETFIADMGDPPEGYTLARRDPNGNFDLENCVWAPRHRHYINGRINPDYVPPRPGLVNSWENFACYIKLPHDEKAQLYGPFPSRQAAIDCAEEIVPKGSYYVIPLKHPPKRKVVAP